MNSCCKKGDWKNLFLNMYNLGKLKKKKKDIKFFFLDLIVGFKV